MATSKHVVTGDQYMQIDGRMSEIKRQLRLDNGSPLDPEDVLGALQNVVEGKFSVLTNDGTYEQEIDYDDPQWKKIDPDIYAAFVSDFMVSDFPITETGKKKFRFRELAFDNGTSVEAALAKAKQHFCHQPDRAQIETIIRNRYTTKQLRKNPRIGVMAHWGQDGRVAVVRGDEEGVKLGWSRAGFMHRSCRFVVVCND